MQSGMAAMGESLSGREAPRHIIPECHHLLTLPAAIRRHGGQILGAHHTPMSNGGQLRSGYIVRREAECNHARHHPGLTHFRLSRMRLQHHPLYRGNESATICPYRKFSTC